MHNVNQLSQWITESLAGQFNGDPQLHSCLEKATAAVLDYFCYDQRLAIKQTPDAWQEQIKQGLQQLALDEPRLWRDILRLASPKPGPRDYGDDREIKSGQNVSIRGDHNQVLNSAGCVSITTGGVASSPLNVMDAVFGRRPPQTPVAESGVEAERILFLCANPAGRQLKLDRDISTIASCLKQAKLRDQFQLIQRWAVTPGDLRQALLDEAPSIVHFSGHGGQQGIILQDAGGQAQIMSAAALATLFKVFSDSVQCVVLNSCYSVSQGRAIAAHIPYVIGMNSRISDSAAVSFCSGFYQGAGAGKSIPVAFELAKSAMETASPEQAAAPVLLQGSGD